MNLDYDSTLTPELVSELERAGRWVGLPLRELELLGQSREKAEAFVASVDQGDHESFLEDVDWQHLTSLLHDRPSLADLYGWHDRQAPVAQ